jgi:hypothetical protein
MLFGTTPDYAELIAASITPTGTNFIKKLESRLNQPRNPEDLGITSECTPTPTLTLKSAVKLYARCRNADMIEVNQNFGSRR